MQLSFTIFQNLRRPASQFISRSNITDGTVQASDTAKLSVDPLSSSQLITGINAQLILDQGARDAQDIYRNISGVSLFSYAGVTARGFRQEEIFFDGLRGDPYVGFNVP